MTPLPPEPVMDMVAVEDSKRDSTPTKSTGRANAKRKAKRRVQKASRRGNR